MNGARTSIGLSWWLLGVVSVRVSVGDSAGILVGALVVQSLGHERRQDVSQFLLETVWVERRWDVGRVIGLRASVANSVRMSFGLWLATAWVDWRRGVGQAGEPWLSEASGWLVFVWQ